MGIGAQRLHRRKAAEGTAARPSAAPALPQLIPREDHVRALQELKKSYELRLGSAGLTPGEREELVELRRVLEEAKTECQPMLDELKRRQDEIDRLATEIEQAQAHIRDLEESNADAPAEAAASEATASAASETRDAEAGEAPKPSGEEPKARSGKGSRK